LEKILGIKTMFFQNHWTKSLELKQIFFKQAHW